jgi:hypothetical protein
MKRLLCLTTGFALVATAAFGQPIPDPEHEPWGMRTLGTEVHIINSRATSAESTGLAELVTRAIDKSRSLRIVPIRNDWSMEVEAPISMVKDPDGRRVTVTFDVTPPFEQSGRTYKTTCTITQLDRCAADIAMRAERIGHQSEADTTLGLPKN